MFTIYHNEKSDYANHLRSLLEERLEAIRFVEPIAVVIGGDGFFFEMIKKLPDDTVFLPLNGGTLGYCLNDIDVDSIDSFISLVEEKDWKEYSFPKLSLYFKDDTREILLDRGANDIYVERASGQTARLTFKIDEVEMLEEPVICDGLIVSSLK